MKQYTKTGADNANSMTPDTKCHSIAPPDADILVMHRKSHLLLVATSNPIRSEDYRKKTFVVIYQKLTILLILWKIKSFAD